MFVYFIVVVGVRFGNGNGVLCGLWMSLSGSGCSLFVRNGVGG